MGETDEAKNWASLSRAIFDRVLATYSDDGYYYEGMEYWIFSMPWIVHYMDAHAHATGEDLYKTPPGLKNAHKYVSHSTLPGGEFNFDFGIFMPDRSPVPAKATTTTVNASTVSFEPTTTFSTISPLGIAAASSGCRRLAAIKRTGKC